MPLLITATGGFFSQKKEKYPSFLIDVRTTAELLTGVPDLRSSLFPTSLLLIELGDNFADRVLDASLAIFEKENDFRQEKFEELWGKNDNNIEKIDNTLKDFDIAIWLKEKAKVGLICRAGVRSCTAGQLLLESGWKNVHSIKGGIYNAEGWLACGLSLASPVDLGIYSLDGDVVRGAVVT